MFDFYWAPTEIAQASLGSQVVSAVPVRPHAGHASRGEIIAMAAALTLLLLVALAIRLVSPLGPAIAAVAIGLPFLIVFTVRRSWAWHLFRGERRILGKVAVFFSDRVELHDEASIRLKQPIESHPIESVRYSGFTDWANPRLLLGAKSWATERAYSPYIAAALRPGNGTV